MHEEGSRYGFLATKRKLPLLMEKPPTILAYALDLGNNWFVYRERIVLWYDIYLLLLKILTCIFFNPSFLGGFEEGLHALWHDIKLVFRPKIASVSTSHKTSQWNMSQKPNRENHITELPKSNMKRTNSPPMNPNHSNLSSVFCCMTSCRTCIEWHKVEWRELSVHNFWWRHASFVWWTMDKTMALNSVDTTNSVDGRAWFFLLELSPTSS